MSDPLDSITSAQRDLLTKVRMRAGLVIKSVPPPPSSLSLAQLRESASDVLTPDHDDHWLVRWLIGELLLVDGLGSYARGRE